MNIYHIPATLILFIHQSQICYFMFTVFTRVFTLDLSDVSGSVKVNLDSLMFRSEMNMFRLLILSHIKAIHFLA